MWILLALLSAFLTALSGTLAKTGLERIGSNFGFAIQSIVTVVLVWLVVFFQGNLRTEVTKLETRALLYLVSAGVVATIAFLCYFGALSMGQSSRVQPVERLSLVFAVILAALFLGEKINAQIIAGAVLMSVGAVIIALANPGK